MAKNKEGTRVGAIKDRSQVFNPKTEQYIKRDAKTGQFLSSKTTPYKSVTKENKSIVSKK
jgi:hypothetical protein